MLGQWTLEMNHVAAIVSGFSTHQKHVGQEGVRFTLIPKVRQVEAVKYLNENAFATPMWAVDREILRRIEPVGALNRIRNAQNAVMNNLLSSVRFARWLNRKPSTEPLLTRPRISWPTCARVSGRNWMGRR
jgi:hypothetical protein